MAKKCTKKSEARVKVLFCQYKPIAFLPSSSLKLPNCISNDERKEVSLLVTVNRAFCGCSLENDFITSVITTTG